jgi:hypothetical protein
MFLENNGSNLFLNHSTASRVDLTSLTLDFQTELESKSGNDSLGRHVMTNHWEQGSDFDVENNGSDDGYDDLWTVHISELSNVERK